MKKNTFTIFCITAFLILSAFALSAGTSVSTIPAQKESAYQKLCRELDNTIDKYKLLAEKSLAHRAKAIEIAKRLKEKIKKKLPLSGRI